MTSWQAVTFKVDYTLANVAGMEFGSVFITEKGENLAAASVAAGWAKVRRRHCTAGAAPGDAQ